jgi:hypothetical protein
MTLEDLTHEELATRAIRKTKKPEKEIEAILWQEENGGAYRVAKGAPERLPLSGARTESGWLRKRGLAASGMSWEYVGGELYFGRFAGRLGEAYRIVEK